MFLEKVFIKILHCVIKFDIRLPMMRDQAKWIGFALGALVAISVLAQQSHAAVEVEAISNDAPLSLNDSPAPKMPDDEVYYKHELVKPQEVKITTHKSSAEAYRADPTELSTVESTYGVMTERRQGLALYLAPYAGMSNVFGSNGGADFTPKYAAGATGGLVISSNMLVFGSFTYSNQSVTNPSTNAVSMYSLDRTDLMDFKAMSLEGGVRLYILGRESRIRPFFSGALGWTRGSLQYAGNNLQTLSSVGAIYANEFTFNQYGVSGELGAEFAITRQIVLNASYKITAALASNTSADGQSASNYDSTKVAVGNSLSQSASSILAAGLGIYF